MAINSNPNESQRMAHIHDLDIRHQHGIHQTDQINRDEDGRRLKLRVLSLRDENAALKDKLVQKDSRVISATKQGDQARAELDDAKAVARTQGARLKKQTFEMSNLKAEIEAHNHAMQDSGKALQEKFALTRELARLRPEMEHLQSQLINHQAVVAEKHDLRRQLDSLEVELENEKRSKQRARSKEDHGAMGELQSRLEAAEKRLATEKRERDKANKEHDKELSESNGRCERLEERVSTLKTKLKGAQGEAKEAHAELEKCRADLQAANPPMGGANQRAKKTVIAKAEPSRKRRVEETSLEEITIQTPGNDDTANKRPIKKRGTERTGFGEKSTFSITPFLNRTKSLSHESVDVPSPKAAPFEPASVGIPPEATEEAYMLEPEPEPEPEPAQEVDEQHDEAITNETQANAKIVESPKKPKPRGRPKAKVLADTVKYACSGVSGSADWDTPRLKWR